MISLKLFILCIELRIALVSSLWSLRIRPCFTLEGLLETSMLIPLLTLIRDVSVVSAPIFFAICTQLGGLVWPWISKSELHQIPQFFLGIRPVIAIIFYWWLLFFCIPDASTENATSIFSMASWRYSTLGGALYPRWYCCFHILGMACNWVCSNLAVVMGDNFLGHLLGRLTT